MGITRKMLSVCTLGLIDYRSDSERTAKYTRQTRNATRVAAVQNARSLGYQRDGLAQAQVHHVEATGAARPAPAPGWYPDPTGQWRWWDGARWTERVAAPLPPDMSY